MSTKTNLDTYFSCRDVNEGQQEEYVNPMSVADYTNAKTAVVIVPKRVERCAGWNDIEIVALQIDRNGKAPMRLMCQCVGNEDTTAVFYLAISTRSLFVQAARNAGYINSGAIDFAKFVGKKYQALFEYDTYEQAGQHPVQYLKLLELKDYVL